MNSLIKDFVEEVLSFIGIKITRTGTGLLGSRNRFTPSEKDKFKWIQNMNINTVIDVGAHIGESALQFHKLFPNAKIYSFEPLRSCFKQLNSRLKNVPNFVSFNLALSDKVGEQKIYHNEFSASSSLLKMEKLHKEVFPFSSKATLETVYANTLDNITTELNLEDNILLKIDAQGYEDKVIIGSRNILSRIKVIIIETSFYELYEGQPLFSDIYNLLYQQGFIYSGSCKELKSPLDGASLQQDSVFIREQ